MKPYYDEDGITIYHGDCLEVMPALEGAGIDATIADPPYGTTACAWDSVIPFTSMWEQLKRVTRPRAPIVLSSSQPFTSALVMSNPEMFREEIIWEKSKATGHALCNIRHLKAHETICVFSKMAATYNPQKTPGEPYRQRLGMRESVEFSTGTARNDNLTGDRYPRSVVYFKTAESEGAVDHPTQKPLALLRYLILTYTNPGDVVLDFTMGSGTTLRAAKDLGRRAIGIELNEQYCEIAARRLSQEVFAL